MIGSSVPIIDWFVGADSCVLQGGLIKVDSSFQCLSEEAQAVGKQRVNELGRDFHLQLIELPRVAGVVGQVTVRRLSGRQRCQKLGDVSMDPPGRWTRQV